MKFKSLFKIISLIVAVTIIASFGILPTSVSAIDGKFSNDGQGLVVYAEVSSAASGSGFEANWVTTGTTSYVASAKSSLSYTGIGTVECMQMSNGSTANRTFLNKINASVQPVWVSFLWQSDANASNRVEFRLTNPDGTTFTTVFGLRRQTTSGKQMDLFAGSFSAQTSSMSTNKNSGNNFIILKIDGKTVTAYHNPVIAELDFTNEQALVTSLVSQFDGFAGTPAVPDDLETTDVDESVPAVPARPLPAVVTTEQNIVIDNIYFNASSTSRMSRIRVGFDAVSATNPTSKSTANGQWQTIVPYFTMVSDDVVIDEVKKTITGYGKGTVSEFLDLLTVEGADCEILTDTGGTKVGDGEQVAEGMILEITPRDEDAPIFEYILASPVIVKSAGIYTNNTLASYLKAGAATAKAEIYSAMPYPAELSLTYNDGVNAPITETALRTTGIGDTSLVTAAAGTVRGVQGESLTMTLKDEGDNDLVTPIVYLAEEMPPSIASDYVTIDKDELTISGYGNGTAEQFLALMDIEGANYRLLDAAFGERINDTAQIAKGMVLEFTPYNTSVPPVNYVLDAPIIVELAGIYIENVLVDALEEGECAAKAQVYSAMPYPVTLSITHNDGKGSVLTETAERTGEVGLTHLATAVVGMSKNDVGESLTMTLKDGGKDVVTPIVFNGTGVQAELSSEIMSVKGGATAVVTLTFDDGFEASLSRINTMLAARGLRGTSAVWQGRLNGRLTDYRDVYEEGNLDLASHSWSHSKLTTSTSEDTARKEIVDSRDWMQKNFPGQEVLGFVPAENQLPGGISTTLAQESYWAVRRGALQMSTNSGLPIGMNPLSPSTSGANNGSWMNLVILPSYAPGGAGVSTNPGGIHSEWAARYPGRTWAEHIEEVSNTPGWLIEMYHSIESNAAYGAVTLNEATARLDTYQRLQDEGKIWVATFNEAIKYLREKQNTTIADRVIANVRTIIPTMTNLPADTFNYPLTVRSRVPLRWSAEGNFVEVKQGGRIQAPTVKIIDGLRYVDYEMIPSGGPVTLKMVNQMPDVTINDVKVTPPVNLTADSGTALTFKATPVPAENADVSGIYWYVNGVKQTQLGGGVLTFPFLSDNIGKFDIYAKDDKSGIQSKTFTVTLRTPGQITYVDYENYSVGDTSGTGAVAAEYPEGSGNIASLRSGGAATWPADHRTATMVEEEPTTFSGRVAMVGTTQQFFLEARATGASSGTNMLRIKNNQVIFFHDGDEVTVAKIPSGEWVNFSLSITPKPLGTLSPVRLVLSGDKLTDASGNNEGQTLAFDITKNLDSLKLVTNGSVNMVYNNQVTTAATERIYLDDVFIYRLQPFRAYTPNARVAINEDIKIEFNNNVFNLTSSDIVVKNSQGTVPSSSYQVIYDNTRPKWMTLDFNNGVLQKSETYTVIINEESTSPTVVNAAGDVLTANAVFTTSDFDPITGLSISTSGALEQNADEASTVTFTAAPTPSGGDPSTIAWYINGERQSATGLEFSYTPFAAGKYTVYAAVDNTAIKSNAIDINVAFGASESLSITSTGKLVQKSTALEAITFTAAGVPEGSILNPALVNWYLNDKLQTDASGSATFSYTPLEVGDFSVYAQIGTSTASKSNIINGSVFIPPSAVPGYIMYDEFNNHGPAGTIISSTNGNVAPFGSVNFNDSARAAVENDAGNLVGKILATASGNIWTQLTSPNFTVEHDKAFVVTGDIRFTGAGNQFAIELNSGANPRAELMRINRASPGNIWIGGEVAANLIPNAEANANTSEWIYYALHVTPRLENLEGGGTRTVADIRLVLSGAARGTVKVIERNGVVMNGFTVGSRSIRINTSVTTVNFNHIDNMKVFEYAPVTISIPSTQLLGSTKLDLLLSHDIDPNTVISAGAGSVTVSGRTVTNVAIDPLMPDRLTVTVDAPFEAGVEYEIAMGAGVKDISGAAITDKTDFTIVQTNDFAVIDTYFAVNGAKVNSVSTSDNVSAKVVIDRDNIPAGFSVYAVAAQYKNKKLVKLWADTLSVPAGGGETILNLNVDGQASGGELKLMVWRDKDSMEYLYKTTGAPMNN